MGAEPLRVLCVDDNRDLADSEAMLLGLCGCAVETCYDGAAALARALRFGPDVCLLDLNMPEVDGFEVAGRLRAWRRGRPVYLIAVTAYGSDEARAQAAAAGFDRHVVKPVDWPALSAELAAVGRWRRKRPSRSRWRPTRATPST